MPFFVAPEDVRGSVCQRIQASCPAKLRLATAMPNQTPTSPRAMTRWISSAARARIGNPFAWLIEIKGDLPSSG